jgi:hypothetical protein
MSTSTTGWKKSDFELSISTGCRRQGILPDKPTLHLRYFKPIACYGKNSDMQPTCNPSPADALYTPRASQILCLSLPFPCSISL